MQTMMLILILATLTMTSLFARADDYSKERRQIFVLEKSEYLDDMYKYLVCLLATGDKGDGHVDTATAYCKNSAVQNAVLEKTNPTEQMVYSSLKPYGYAIQTMIICLARGGSKSSRARTIQVIEYCDKIVRPLD